MTTSTPELTGSAEQEQGPQAPAGRRRRQGGGLGSYLLVRLLLIFPTIFILVTTVFFLMRSTGDPITAALGGRLPPDQLQQRIHEAGYDRPLIAQYLDYLGGIVHGDFGTTSSDRRPVLDVLTTFGTATLELAFYALIVAFIVGIPLGMLAAYFRDRYPDAILPGLALGLLTAGVFLRLLRTNVIGTLGAGYVEAARSRGVREYRLLRKHAYRPALIPIVTVIGLQIALLLVGAVLTETTFEWKGLGFQLSEYLKARDFVAVQGIVALLAVIVAVTNFIVDIIAALIDPRVRY
jgi:peptide/nickel transport system permease protein